jgi:L-ascorbate metabolism protein UlaG (beta-lactamase superfamily)
MIEPVLSGSALIEQVGATRPKEGRAALWWLGQCGYLLRWHELTVALDPYLSNHLAALRLGPGRPYERQLEPPFEPAQMRGLDLIVVTGAAPDQLDPESIGPLLAASERALLALPAGLADFAADDLGLPEDRLVPIRDREFFDLAGLRLHALAVAGDGEAATAATYILAGEGLSLWHGGPLTPAPDLAERVAAYRPRLALLPISGRGARLQALGQPGVLTPAEAARLAAEVGAEVLAPNHYDLFAAETADVEAFCQHVAHHHPGLRVKLLEPGARWYYPGQPG